MGKYLGTTGLIYLWNKIKATFVSKSEASTTYSPKLVIMSYGETNAWNKFITAYQANAIVYCRASSNTNPATGAQGRLAFLAYVNNGDNPTEVEFQYYRSVSTHSDST